MVIILDYKSCKSKKTHIQDKNFFSLDGEVIIHKINYSMFFYMICNPSFIITIMKYYYDMCIYLFNRELPANIHILLIPESGSHFFFASK